VITGPATRVGTLEKRRRKMKDRSITGVIVVALCATFLITACGGGGGGGGDTTDQPHLTGTVQVQGGTNQ